MDISLIKQLYPDTKSIREAESLIKDVTQVRLGLNVNEIKYIVSAADSYALSDQMQQGAWIKNIGGLGGFPFQGLSALRSVPGNGSSYEAIVILYAADIDLNDELTGAEQESATNMAIGKLMANRILLDHISDLDYQMNFIEQVLHRDQRRIKSADYPLLEAAEVMYEVIDNRMQLLFSKTEYQCRYVILAGGIQINDRESNESHFIFKRFDCVEPLTKTKIDWTRINLGVV
ncbi:hypothetical protein LZG71_20580 [Dyadobacter sp. CY312]|nr:hypothetical protein [Dyadobacter sp. CY312]